MLLPWGSTGCGLSHEATLFSKPRGGWDGVWSSQIRPLCHPGQGSRIMASTCWILVHGVQGRPVLPLPGDGLGRNQQGQRRLPT